MNKNGDDVFFKNGSSISIKPYTYELHDSCKSLIKPAFIVYKRPVEIGIPFFHKFNWTGGFDKKLPITFIKIFIYQYQYYNHIYIYI